MRSLLATTSLILFCLFTTDASAQSSSGLDTIQSEDLQARIEFLADDLLGGRDTPSDGLKLAGLYAASLFKEWGLVPLPGRENAARPFHMPVPITVKKGTVPETMTDHNIVAMIHGSDPELKNEYIIIGAHLDHLGTNTYGKILNGADDNASGSAAILEIAEAFASLPEPPKRSLIFALWTGEERGLFGSTGFVKNSPMPLASIKAYINVDMVGRSLTKRSVLTAIATLGLDYDQKWREYEEEYYANGVGVISRAEEPWMLETIQSTNEQLAEINLFHIYHSEKLGPSDHLPFSEAGVPIVFFSTGYHDDYHKPTDTAEKIRFGHATRITRLIYLLTLTLAQS